MKIHIPGISNNDILAIYSYGSRVYGTHNRNSDNDYIVVVTSNYPKVQQIMNGNDNFNIYNEDNFKQLIKEHEISVLECLSLPYQQGNKIYFFELCLSTLRESISKKASNSWVKAKKKMTIEKDFNLYIAKKSLFHSLRILIFGIQIAKYGKVINLSEANSYWEEIRSMESEAWEDYKNIYQPIYNKLKSQLKQLAPLS